MKTHHEETTMKRILILCALILSGCTSSCAKKAKDFTYHESTFAKGAVLKGSEGESTPVVWNGKLLRVTSTMTSWSSANQGTLSVYDGDELLSRIDTTFSLGSPIVDNGVLYVVGSRNWDQASNAFYIVSTTDLVNWTSEQMIFSSAPGTILYNNSITRADDKFVMSYEFCQAGSVCFAIKFKQSYDLITWTDIGGQFRPFEYVACPSLKYLNGAFYMFYGSQIPEREPACETKISKSVNLSQWLEGGIVITPRDGSSKDDICDSDFDLVEHNGNLEALYLEGDQKTWFNLRRASYSGTFEKLISTIKF